MRRQPWLRFLWQYVLPTILLSIPWAIPWLDNADDTETDDGTGLMLLVLFVLAPLTALVIGLLMRPAHVWIPQVAALAVLWIGIATVQGVGDVDADAMLAMLFLLTLPWTGMIWLGTWLRNWLGAHWPPSGRTRRATSS